MTRKEFKKALPLAHDVPFHLYFVLLANVIMELVLGLLHVVSREVLPFWAGFLCVLCLVWWIARQRLREGWVKHCEEAFIKTTGRTEVDYWWIYQSIGRTLAAMREER